jgi:hypothetical protein
MLLTSAIDTNQLSMAQESVSNETLTIRKTATSVPGVPSSGHEDHQIVMALPPIDNEKLWVGKVSWISSEPIEVGFLIAHNQIATDTEHSQIETLQLGENSRGVVYASTNLTGATPHTTFGNMDFVVDQLAFHSTNNTKFTVTYAIDALAKDLTEVPQTIFSGNQSQS